MLHVFLLELFVVEIGVVAFVLKQLFVRALFDDLACADDQNKVGFSPVDSWSPPSPTSLS